MATSPKLTVEVVTGERMVFRTEDVDMVLAPGADGQMGILPYHAALFSLLEAGELVVRKGIEEEALVVFGGFIEVVNNKVLVLADTAEHVEEIDVERAERARQRAEERLADDPTDIDTGRALAALRRARIRIQVTQRRRREGAPTPARQAS